MFDYASSAAATSDASKVSAAGTPIGTTQITWIAPPRFYRKEQLIVLYVGSNADVLRALEAVLGKPFAGAAEALAGRERTTRTYHGRVPLVAGRSERIKPR